MEILKSILLALVATIYKWQGCSAGFFGEYDFAWYPHHIVNFKSVSYNTRAFIYAPYIAIPRYTYEPSLKKVVENMKNEQAITNNFSSNDIRWLLFEPFRTNKNQAKSYKSVKDLYNNVNWNRNNGQEVDASLYSIWQYLGKSISERNRLYMPFIVLTDTEADIHTWYVWTDKFDFNRGWFYAEELRNWLLYQIKVDGMIYATIDKHFDYWWYYLTAMQIHTSIVIRLSDLSKEPRPTQYLTNLATELFVNKQDTSNWVNTHGYTLTAHLEYQQLRENAKEYAENDFDLRFQFHFVPREQEPFKLKPYHNFQHRHYFDFLNGLHVNYTKAESTKWPFAIYLHHCEIKAWAYDHPSEAEMPSVGSGWCDKQKVVKNMVAFDGDSFLPAGKAKSPYFSLYFIPGDMLFTRKQLYIEMKIQPLQVYIWNYSKGFVKTCAHFFIDKKPEGELYPTTDKITYQVAKDEIQWAAQIMTSFFACRSKIIYEESMLKNHAEFFSKYKDYFKDYKLGILIIVPEYYKNPFLNSEASVLIDHLKSKTAKTMSHLEDVIDISYAAAHYGPSNKYGPFYHCFIQQRATKKLTFEFNAPIEYDSNHPDLSPYAEYVAEACAGTKVFENYTHQIMVTFRDTNIKNQARNIIYVDFDLPIQTDMIEISLGKTRNYGIGDSRLSGLSRTYMMNNFIDVRTAFELFVATHVYNYAEELYEEEIRDYPFEHPASNL